MGVALTDLVPPDQAPSVSALLERSRTESATVEMPVDLRWSGVKSAQTRLVVSPLAAGEAVAFAFALTPGPGPTSECVETVERYEHLFRQITAQIRAAGVDLQDPIATAGRDRWVHSDSAMAGLSSRQADILGRLVRGQRVSTIAKAMYVSESTVRNHLCAIYRKRGVHSQAELLEKLLDSGGDGADAP